MLKIRQISKSLTYTGIDTSTDESLAKYMLITHQMTITWIPLVLVFLFVFYSAGAFFFAQMLSILLATHFLVFYFSKRKWFTLTRILEIIVPVTTVQLGSAIDFAVDINIRAIFFMYIVAFSVIPFLFFPLKEYKPMLFCFIWIVMCWISFDPINIRFGTTSAPSLTNNDAFTYFAGAGALALMLTTIWYFKIANERYERTVSMLIQKNSKQNTAMAEQANVLIQQNKKLSSQHKKIIHSLTYASSIQSSVLPQKKITDPFFAETFCLFKPRDIVSGDFFWHKKIMDKLVICVADCTGHGVPGALTSMLAVSYLNEIIKQSAWLSPAHILAELNKKMDAILNKNDNRNLFHHSLDIAVLSIDTKKQKAEYASAKNSMIILRKNSLTEIRGNRQSIGTAGNSTRFSNIDIELKKSDLIYLFTDGYADQLDGQFGNKIKKRTLKNLLYQNKNAPLEQQQQMLENYFEEWRGTNEQTDDILIVGLKL